MFPLNQNNLSLKKKNQHFCFSQSAGIMNKVKIALLITLWILFTAMLMLKDEKVLTNHQMTIAANSKTSGPFPVFRSI